MFRINQEISSVNLVGSRFGIFTTVVGLFQAMFFLRIFVCSQSGYHLYNDLEIVMIIYDKT
jgi:hypothetical protein